MRRSTLADDRKAIGAHALSARSSFPIRPEQNFPYEPIHKRHCTVAPLHRLYNYSAREWWKSPLGGSRLFAVAFHCLPVRRLADLVYHTLTD
jgi:hypothetical protein